MDTQVDHSRTARIKSTDTLIKTGSLVRWATNQRQRLPLSSLHFQGGWPSFQQGIWERRHSICRDHGKSNKLDLEIENSFPSFSDVHPIWIVRLGWSRRGFIPNWRERHPVRVIPQKYDWPRGIWTWRVATNSDWGKDILSIIFDQLHSVHLTC